LVSKEDDTKNQENSHSSPSEGDVLESEEEIVPCEGELFLVRKLLKSQLVKLEQSQCENLFYTRCNFFLINLLWYCE